MHIQWDINVGALIGWAITLVGIIFTAGKIAAALTGLGDDVRELKSDFRKHQEEDVRRFEAIQKTLMEIVMKG